MAFRSGLEEKIADLLVNLGCCYEYEHTRLNYTIKHYYLPDFRLENGIFLEAKGYWEPEDRRKIKNVIEQNPDVDIRMVFQNPYLKINKRSKTTYAMWCEKHNIKYCNYGSIPLEWLRIPKT